MKLKKLIAALLAGALLLSLAACGGGGGSSDNNDKQSSSDTAPDKPPVEQVVDYSTYGSYWFPQHDYKTMPIGAYNSCPPKEGEYTKNFLLSEELFENYYYAGVNTMMGLTDYISMHESSVMTALDYCYDYEMAYLLAYLSAWDVRSETTVRSTLARVMHHDSFAGIMLSDEPGKVMFEKMAASRSIFEKVLGETSDKLYHSNLFPTYANQKQLWFRSYTSSDVLPVDSYTYQQYVDDYMQTYNPQVLSYDFYPITGEFPRLSDGYFANMSIIRNAALKANVPFWTYVQTCSFRNGQRLPTEADLLWNVNTCLAYGAKGIQYFCGVVPNDGGEIFNGAMFDESGEPTEVYYHVKKANSQIKAVDEVLMCSKSKGVIYAGLMPALNNGTDARMTAPDTDKLFAYNELVSVESDHALVGCFDYNGKTALYVVNNAIADDATSTAATSVTLSFDGSCSGYTVQQTAKAGFNAQSSLTLQLAAGEGVLVVIE